MSAEKKWYEWLTGSLEDKRRYRQYKVRAKQLPAGYREAHEGVERYLMYRGGLTKGDELVQMLEDLVELMERAAADGTPVPAVIGDDPVEFAEDFLANYTDSQWINKERDRLRTTIERAARQDGEREG